MKIFVATHKHVAYPEDNNYCPVQNGRAISDTDLGIPGDNTGFNISEKMTFYSELCSLFWILNNCDEDIVGLVHYRRYFAPVNHSEIMDGQPIATSLDFHEIGNFDLVVCASRDLGPQSVSQQYAECHFESDLATLRLVLGKLYPAYITGFDSVMQGSDITLYNMFVGRVDVMRAYGDWLFPLLFLLEDWIPYRKYGFYQQRVFAFLAERLFTVWLKVNETRLAVARRPIVFLSF